MSREVFLANGRIAGALPQAPQTLRIVDGVVAEHVHAAPAGAQIIDARGAFLAPMVVDAHVHLAFAAEAHAKGAPALEALAQLLLARGVCGALDLGMPERLLPALAALAQVRFVARSAGPLLTAPSGYPTQSWGRDGYGLGLATAHEARAAVARLADAGACAVKLALDARFAVLAPEVARAAADEGHARGLRVFAHALDANAVWAALEAGADVLAHTPTEALPEALVREAGARGLHVLSTLDAFGGGPELAGNLARLRAAGARVVYGTDLGNEGTSPRIAQRELSLLAAAGLSAREILACATEAAAFLLGDPSLGHLRPGAAANVLALRTDPLVDAAALANPLFVVAGGAVMASPAET